MSLRHGRSRASARLRCEALEGRDAPAAAPVIDIRDGFGQGRMPGGPEYGLTPGPLVLTNRPFQSTAVWSGTRVDVRRFETSFVFRQEGEPGQLGDGFTFALASGGSYSGAAGGGLGYAGMTNSVAVKFDLVDNAGEGGHSVGVFTGGAEPTMPAVRLDDSPIHLHAQHPIRADLKYDGAVLTVTLTDTTLPDHVWTHPFPVDIPVAVGASTGLAGFTAGTGSLVARQSIDWWTYSEDPPAPAGQPPVLVAPPEVHMWDGRRISLSAEATDDGGPANLTYSWEAVAAPAGANPVVRQEPFVASPPYTVIELDRGGAYTFRLTVRDADGQTATAVVDYVHPTAWQSIDVFPTAATVSPGGTVQFQSVIRDQFGNPMSLDPGWQVFRGPGTIDSRGLYTVPADASGWATVRAIMADPRMPESAWKYIEIPVSILAPRPAAVDLGSGSAGSDLTLNGSAQVVGDRLRLADARYQAGSAYAAAPVDVRGFTTRFRFQVGDAPSWWHGDGLTFVLQNAGPEALGAAGGGLGYAGIDRSVAVKFDLVDNAGEGADSIGVFTGGAAPTTPADGPTGRLHLNSGREFEVELRYAGGTLFVDLSDPVWGEHFTRTYAVDIPAAVGGPTALVGFTAGTGELFAPIDVLTWTYTPTTDAAGDAAPALVDRPRADAWYVAGTSTQFRVEAFDDGPAGDLRYTWEVVSVPPGAGPVAFSANGDNAARTTTATFTRTGRYSFRVAVTDAQGNWARSDPFWVQVDPVPGSYVITPAAPAVLNGTALDVKVQTLDQFGDAWVGRGGGYGFEVVGPGYFQSTSGDYYAPVTGTGPVTLRHIDGSATGSATVTVVDLPPTTVAGFSAGFDERSRSTIAGSAIRRYPWVWLTQGTPDQAGASFHATRLDVTAFETKFRVRLGWPSTAGAGTGMAFVVQGVSPTAVGAAGAGLGYQGIDRSVAVTLDAAANAIGLGVNGAAPTGLVSLAGTGVDLRSGDHLEGDVVYDGTNLRVNLTDVDTGATATATWAVDIPAAVGGGTAFVGFTGATGDTVDRYATQSVESWRFRTVPVEAPDQPPAFLRPPRLVPNAWYSTSYAYRQVRAADDGGPFNLRTRWELVSAPPGAKPYFYPAEDDLVRFDKIGEYLFRVTATDVAGQSAVAYVPYTVESVS